MKARPPASLWVEKASGGLGFAGDSNGSKGGSILPH